MGNVNCCQFSCRKLPSAENGHLSNNASDLSAAVTDSLTVNRKNAAWIQLAGHPGNFVPAGPKSIWKKQPNGDYTEANCLRDLMQDSTREVVPKYFRQVEQDGVLYVEMEDLLKNFTDPNVMDVKIGTRTFLESEVENPELRSDLYEKMIKIDPTAPTAEEHQLSAITKLRYMQFREQWSTSAVLGFRIEATKRFSEPSNNDFKKVRIKEGVMHAIWQFVNSQTSVCRQLLNRLKEIRSCFQSSDFFKHHEVIGSSLLFVYDDKSSNIWMIDFAKTIPLSGECLTHQSTWIPGNHEDGYITGLNSLIQIFEELSSGNGFSFSHDKETAADKTQTAVTMLL